MNFAEAWNAVWLPIMVAVLMLAAVFGVRECGDRMTKLENAVFPDAGITADARAADAGGASTEAHPFAIPGQDYANGLQHTINYVQTYPFSCVLCCPEAEAAERSPNCVRCCMADDAGIARRVK